MMENHGNKNQQNSILIIVYILLSFTLILRDCSNFIYFSKIICLILCLLVICFFIGLNGEVCEGGFVGNECCSCCLRLGLRENCLEWIMIIGYVAVVVVLMGWYVVFLTLRNCSYCILISYWLFEMILLFLTTLMSIIFLILLILILINNN